MNIIILVTSQNAEQEKSKNTSSASIRIVPTDNKFLIIFCLLALVNLSNSQECSYIGGFGYCLNGGNCNPLNGICSCAPGFRGPACGTVGYPSACKAGGIGYCLNGGYCNAATGLCQCLAGYTGPACAQTFFAQNSGCNAYGVGYCLNGGYCNTATGLCQCSAGFSGSICATVLGCNAGCLNGGSCNPSTGLCSCLSGYTGSTCGIFLSFFQSASGCNAGGQYVCSNGGSCNPSTGFCSCPTGYSGPACATVIGCTLSGIFSCLNGFYCNPQTGSCICQSGSCENINACGSDSSPMLCATFAASNFCSFNFMYNSQHVPLYCPVSCKYCNQVLVPICRDAQHNCNFLVSINGCSTLNWITQNCKKSCHLC